MLPFSRVPGIFSITPGLDLVPERAREGRFVLIKLWSLPRPTGTEVRGVQNTEASSP